MNAFCEKCGSPVNPGAAFCHACGQKIGEAPNQYAQPQYAQPQYSQPQYSQPQYAPQYATAPKSKKTLIIVLAAVLAVAALAVTLILVLGGPSIPAEKLNGIWSGTVTPQVVNDGAEDTTGLTKDNIGSEEEFSFELSLDEKGDGTLSFGSMECGASLRGATLTAEQKNADMGLMAYFEAGVTASSDSYSLQGTWRFTDNSGNLLASGTWTGELQ